MHQEQTPAFEALSPDFVIDAVEAAFGLDLSGVMLPYASYINRVYGLEAADGARYVVKFYRPGRWSVEAILEEHRFVSDCRSEDLPVVAPIVNSAGTSLQSAFAESEDGETRFLFALYPSRGGRQFDAERDDDWIRLGALVGRMHLVGLRRSAAHRLVCTPEGTTARYLEELRDAEVVHPDSRDAFFDLSQELLEVISPRFSSIEPRRIHGDCHRGNILDRPGEGLMLIDFDDMMIGPPVQDLWLLLPDYADESRRELELILEGYEQFLGFDRATLSLIEPLRFMRIIHFLAWQTRQRHDRRFMDAFPDWGGKAFWIKEVEDLSMQRRVIRGIPVE